MSKKNTYKGLLSCVLLKHYALFFSHLQFGLFAFLTISQTRGVFVVVFFAIGKVDMKIQKQK